MTRSDEPGGAHGPGDGDEHRHAGEPGHTHDHGHSSGRGHTHEHGDSSGHDHSHTHGHAHGHGYGHGQAGTEPVRLWLAAGGNVGFAVIQITVGLVLGSVVVLADALHQVVDAVGLVTALIALAVARRPARTDMTFGFGKADALGGYTSALLLLGSVAWVGFEAVRRLFDPVAVDGEGVILIGIAGVVVNGASVWILGHGHELSLKAARLHLLVDLAGSVVVVAAGAVLAGTSLTWVDPAASLVINVLVVQSTIRLLRHAGAELLDRAPTGADADAVRARLLGRPEVVDVHHVHARSMGPGQSTVTAHVVVDGSMRIHDAQDELDHLRRDLAQHLGIEHSTIQLECHECADVDH